MAPPSSARFLPKNGRNPYAASASSYKKVIIHQVIALAALALLSGSPRAQTAPVSEYAVKSALLFKLPRFTYLPRLKDGTRVTLCVLGRNPFGGALEKLAQTPIDGRSVQVRQPEDAAHALDCDLVFIARSESARLKSTLRQLGEAPVATVSDIEGFAHAGGMVEMALNPEGGGSLNLLINRKAAQAHDIDFNAQLLRLARIVE